MTLPRHFCRVCNPKEGTSHCYEHFLSEQKTEEKEEPPMTLTAWFISVLIH